MAKRTIRFSPRQKRTKREVAEVLGELRQRNKDLLLALETNVGRALIRAGQLIEARAKEIITEKGHVVTGNLRRSINTQLLRIGKDRIAAEVGTFVLYAPSVELLPDGGFLFPASEEMAPAVFQILAREGVVASIELWGR